MATANPFLDPAVRPTLYGRADRLAQRTSVLHSAKIAGRYVPSIIADLAVASSLPPGSTAADLGCGRGSSTIALAKALPADSRIIGVDLSPAMLMAARERARSHRNRIRLLQADFHSLPLRAGTCRLVVAAFCLYHSRNPSVVIAEVARCLAPGGLAVLVTKSADSYRELDELLSATGLDLQAPVRPSLYETAHSNNLPGLVDGALKAIEVTHELHRFQFKDLHCLAQYLATTPKYVLPTSLKADPLALAAELRLLIGERPITTSSTVTYVLARRREAP